MGQLLEIDLVLLPLRLVQAEVFPQRRLELDRAGVAFQAGDSIAGQGAEQHEVERDSDEHRHQREERSLQDVVAALHSFVSSAALPVVELVTSDVDR
jgi:hypothetical protein